MGAVFRPKDLSKKYRKIISNNDAIKDLSPDTKDSTIDIQDDINIVGEEVEISERTSFDKDLGKKDHKKSLQKTNNSNTDSDDEN